MRSSFVALVALACGGPATSAPAAAPAEPRALVAAPVPRAERLAPCAVQSTHTEYDEETRAPHVTTAAARSLARLWPDDREGTRWMDLAPIPLTRDQATTELGADAIRLLDDGGALAWTFDALGRTETVRWDPVADSSDYAYSYRYDCDTGPLPWEDDVDGE